VGQACSTQRASVNISGRAYPGISEVNGVLRAIGLLNLSIWFGAGVFFTFFAGPAVFSGDMKELLGPANYPYFSGAIAQLLITRYFRLQIICAIIAVLHLWADRMYVGRLPEKRWSILTVAFLALALLSRFWLQPKLHALHKLRHAVNAAPEVQAAAAKAFGAWHGVAQTVNLLMLLALAIYLYRITLPPSVPRFVTPKFHS
jgi:Domain of unknown function (DUF4149)